MNRFISFSLYGNDPKYVRGLYENLRIKKEQQLYQDWKVVVFHDNTLTEEILNHLNNHDVELIDMTESGILAASWRFCVADLECERFIIRDSDSRFSKREEEAVQEWIKDDTILHIMRDHPHHGYPILGGMWGMKADVDFCMKTAILKYQGGQAQRINERDVWIMKDMDFLRDVIYPEFAKPDQSTIHNAKDFMSRVQWQCENWAKDFPNPIDSERYFVGEIFIFDEDNNEQREYQYKER